MEDRIKQCEKILNFSLRSKRALAEINVSRHAEYSFLKPLQSLSVKSAVEGDTLVILPTGYGKSLIFELIPKINMTKVLIISPLNAIIEEQMGKLAGMAIKIDQSLINDLDNAGSRLKTTERFMCANATYLIGHPEHVLNKSVCDVLRQTQWEKVSSVVIDEAHCVVNWGQDFRPDFKKLSKLRAIFPNAYVTCMTATATVSMQTEIAQTLMMKNVKTICTSIDRKNVKLTVSKRLPITGGKHTAEESLTDIIDPLVRELCTDPLTFPRTIVYTKLKYCGEGYEAVNRVAKTQANADSIMTSVSQYHAPSTEKMKKAVVQDLGQATGKIRLLFATEAYGMGADAPDIRRIVHIGPPSSLETYLQEIGRAGRDGESSDAVLRFNMTDVSATSNVKQEMKDYCFLKTCRRKFVADHFGFDHVGFEEDCLHRCCDICESQCACDTCLISGLEDTCLLDDTTKVTVIKNKDELSVLEQLLGEYFSAENENETTFSTGLSVDLAEKIVRLYQSTETLTEEDLERNFNQLNKLYLYNISSIVSHVRQLHRT